jgi:hypothetical protein
MKKLVLTVAAVFAFGFANAQETKFGVKAGLNLANVNGDDVSDNSSRLSFHVGGFAEIKLDDKFAIQPELVYSVQGTKIDVGASEDLVYDLQYINVPVMAKYYATEQLSLEVGPQIGFLTSAKAKFDGDSQDIKDTLKSTDFGVNFGAGYNFTENISAGLRYNLGLSNIADADGADVKNSVLSLSVGYKF